MLKSVINAVLRQTKMAAHIRQFRVGIRHGHDNLRRPCIFRDRLNPLEDLPQEEVFRKYRFRPRTILYILQIIPDSVTITSLPTVFGHGGHTYSYRRHDGNI